MISPRISFLNDEFMRVFGSRQVYLILCVTERAKDKAGNRAAGTKANREESFSQHVSVSRWLCVGVLFAHIYLFWSSAINAAARLSIVRRI